MSHHSTAGGLRTLASGLALAAVAAAVPLLAAGTATAHARTTAAVTVPQAWAEPAKVTTRTAVRDVRELVLTADGTAVALWTQRPAAAGADALYAAVRRPGATAWGAPRRLGAAQIHEVKLVAVGAGATALWTDAPGGGYTATRLVSASLAGGSWSAAVPVATARAGHKLSRPGLAAAADGTVTAAWGDGRPESYAAPKEVRTATRPASGRWSAAVTVSRPVNSYTGLYGTAQVAVDRRGTTVIAYTQADSEESSRVLTVTRRAGSRTWSAPALRFRGYGRAPAVLAEGPAAGSLALVWQDGSPDHMGHGPVHVATTADAAAGWPVVRRTAEPEGLAGRPARPQLDRAGTVTLLWTDGQSRLLTAALPRAADRWSPVEALSSGPSIAGYDVSTGPDGTARVLWTERRTFPAQELVQAVRPAGGRWTVAPMRAAAGPGLDAEVVAGPGGRALAVWSRQDTPDAGTLWAAGSVPVPAVAGRTGRS
ncbi:hypothetical protein [Streptomyces sp. NPDC089919]|uniref:hypothetical protein n=1 Tax=Streptomyces sp. NPDC089919 TaxID=3155188 RepID=UPI00342BA353